MFCDKCGAKVNNDKLATTEDKRMKYDRDSFKYDTVEDIYEVVEDFQNYQYKFVEFATSLKNACDIYTVAAKFYFGETFSLSKELEKINNSASVFENTDVIYKNFFRRRLFCA